MASASWSSYLPHDRPEARAPAAVPDLAVAHQRSEITRPPGQPGGLSCMFGPVATRSDPTARTAPQPTRNDHQAEAREDRARGPEGRGKAMYAIEYGGNEERERWRLDGALRGRHGPDHRALLLGGARRHCPGQGVLSAVVWCSEACLGSALERHEPWGVWGGELLVNGRVIANKRRRGRPPKHPRPRTRCRRPGSSRVAEIA